MEEISKLDELKQEADALGIKYVKNIGEEKLQAKIDEFYEKESEANTAKVVVKEEVKEAEPKKVVEDPRQAALRQIKMQERANMATKVVKIAMVDKREASTATHAYFSTGRVQMNVPLDIFVEMPVILIKQAEDAKALVHKEQNGEMVHMLQKKYVVEYK